MDLALFTGHVVNKMDRKGRVSVPASFRNELVSLSFPGIVLFPSPEGIPPIDGAGEFKIFQVGLGLSSV